MKKAIVFGAAGFTGTALVEKLREIDVDVYAVLRPASLHNKRLAENDVCIHKIEIEMEDIASLSDMEIDDIDTAFYLTWLPGTTIREQMKNVEYILKTEEVASTLGCRRFVATGSQAEYGVVPKDKTAKEDDTPLKPFSAYGTAKVAASYLGKHRALELGMDWVWGRIFSLIGKYEPKGRMLPDLYQHLKAGKTFNLSSCTQNWDYLDIYDAADALIALAENGRSGETYHIANGKYRPLKDYTERLQDILGVRDKIIYGNDPNPYVSLQPSVEKIKNDTGWNPKRLFRDSILDY